MSRTRFRYWQNHEFPDLPFTWFQKNAARDPEAAWREFQRFLSTSPKADNDVRFRKALQVCSGKSSSAVGHFLSLQRRDSRNDGIVHLSEATRNRLDAIAESLGWRQDPQALQDFLASKRHPKRVAIVTDLRSPPNPRFHLEVLDSIIDAGASRGVSVVMFPLQAITARLRPADFVRDAMADAMVWFRSTPSRAFLKDAANMPAPIPIVVVHGSRVRYPAPVVAHIIPGLASVVGAVEAWARGIDTGKGEARHVVIAAMDSEAPIGDFEPVGLNVPTSLRKGRLDAVQTAIRNKLFQPTIEAVADYTASQAYDLLVKHPQAAAYISLSDEIAVAIKQLLMLRGEPVEGRILGFDGSSVARLNQIPSVDQHLNEIGTGVIDTITAALAHAREAHGRLPSFREIAIEASLFTRSTSVALA